MTSAKDRHRARAVARQLRTTIAPCCPQIVPCDARYLIAQQLHEQLQNAQPHHDRSPSVCCCWDCHFFA